MSTADASFRFSKRSIHEKQTSESVVRANQAVTPYPVLVLFDMMDTLIEDPFFRALPGLMDQSTLRRWARLRNPQAFLDFEAGRIGEALYFREFFRPGADVTGLPAPQKLKKAMMKDIHWLPGIPNLLRRLNCAKGIVSNYSVWYHDVFRQRKDLPGLFDYHFFSCEIGYRKPEREFYQTISEGLADYDPAEIIFFDDREENLKEPGRLGWQTVHIKKDRAAQIIEDNLHRHGLLQS